MEQKAITLKVPVLYRSVPYVYIKMNNIDNRYRLSGNYKYLNEHYGLKINMIRDFDKIEHSSNKYFSIVDNSIDLFKKSDWQNWKMGEGDNTLLVQRMIINHEKENHTIIILTRNFKGDINSSIFFCSPSYYNINHFLEDQIV